MFETLFLIFVCIYFCVTVYLITGIRKSFPKLKEDELPAATVIVAARNEEKNILECLTALNNLVYPEGKLEIIIVDDNSTDSTGNIVDEFIKNKTRFKKVFAENNNAGKPGALAAGIKKASGKILILTDADCRPFTMWAYTTASYYTDGVGIVNGYTTQDAHNWFSGLQAIDFIYLTSVASGTINNKMPVSCIGNNMSFRKQAYLEAGGYENIPFSVTEDYALLNAIDNLGKYKIIYPLNFETLVTSKPCSSFTQLFNQKKRWAVGGLGIKPAGAAIISAAFSTNLLLLLLPLFFSTAYIYLAVFKIAIDFFFMFLIHKSLGIQKSLKYFLFFEIYFIVYTSLLPLAVAFSRKVKWKGRVYN